MQKRLDAELDVLGGEGWDLVDFTTQVVSDSGAAVVLHTFVFRRVRMAGPRAGS